MFNALLILVIILFFISIIRRQDGAALEGWRSFFVLITVGGSVYVGFGKLSAESKFVFYLICNA